MSLTIAFTNTKGGVSKSTLSCNGLLLLHDQGYRVALLDADEKQRSASKWIERAEPTIPIAVATKPSEIRPLTRELEQVADIIIADTPGHSDDLANAVAMLCDLAVVPVQPSKLDVWAIRDAMQFIFLAREVSGGNKPEARIVITHTAIRDVQARQLRATIDESLGIPVLKAEMRQLRAFRDSPTTAVHRMAQAGAATTDIQAIFSELLTIGSHSFTTKRVANE